MDSRRPTTPPPFPTPAQVQGGRAEDLAPAIADLSARVQEQLNGSANSRGEYSVYLTAKDTQEVVDVVSGRLKESGWAVRKLSGVCNDAELIIWAAQ